MKQPADTVPPVVGPNTEKRSLRDLFLPSSRKDSYYEAYSRRGDLYLLWMECARFGVRMAYPCVLREEGSEPLVFASGGEDDAAENAALLRRWEELDISSMAGSLEITQLDKQAFRTRYKQHLRG